MNILVFVVVAFVANPLGESARILGVIPTPSYSHQVWLQPLWKELSLRGHQVTVLTTNPINDPSLINLTEIDTSFSYHVLTDNLLEIINTQNPFKIIELNVKVFSKVIDKQLEHHQVQQLITDPNVHFDLLFTELNGFAAMAFSKRFNCPFIGVLPVDGVNAFHKVVGNPIHPIMYPNPLLGEEDKLSFVQRIMAVVLDLALEWFIRIVYVPIDGEVIQKHFNLNYDLYEFCKEVSILFVNSEPIMHGVRPINPSFVQIGGRPMRMPSKPLPKHLQTVLENATGGFIYFSLGSNVNSKDLSNETMVVIMNTFQELPYTILWKYELEDLPNKPNNVIISKWVPQLEVLKHVNLKLFITHGGMQSIDEGVSARVPMLGIPFFVDQPFNVKKLVNRGCALSLDYRTLEKENFKATILEIINNPVYRNQIQKLADLAEDQPMTGLNRAVWWTEYVLRYNGTRHLRSPVFDIPWYQYYLLDVAVVFLVCFIILIYVFVVILQIIRKILKRITSQSVKIKKE